MMTELFLAFALPALLSAVATPTVIWLANRVGAVDLPNERKVHSTPTPRMGGVAVYTGLFLGLAVLAQLVPAVRHAGMLLPQNAVWFIAGLWTVFVLGIWDDLKALNPGRKFLIQVVAATMVYMGGVRISTVTDLLGPGVFELGFLDYPVTVVWIVGITNAFNLIDGLDGLASGVAFIAAITIFCISMFAHDMANAMVILALAGAIAGFLPYNFHPARIFLGDSGSLLLGFMLAVFSIESSTKGSTAFAVIVPVLALGLPIIDTLLAMIRRILHSLLPEFVHSNSLLAKLRSMFVPDRRHIHHQLMALGLSHRSVVLTLYMVSCVFGLGAFVVTLNNTDASLILLAVGVAMVVGIRHLRYKEMAILRNGMLLPIYEWPVMHRSLFQGFFDLAFCAVAFVGACFFSGGDSLDWRQALPYLPLIGGIQLTTMSLSGLYRGAFRYPGVGDLLRMIKAVALAAVAGAAAIALLPKGAPDIGLAVFITNFYLLLSMVAGTRTSFHVLHYLFRREKESGARVVIYGASANGTLTLQKILDDESLKMKPLGFFDDNPDLEGKKVNGFPVFGGHWKLHRLLKKSRVDAILLACDTMKPEILARVKLIAEEAHVPLRRPRLLLEDVPLHAPNTVEQSAYVLDGDIFATASRVT